MLGFASSVALATQLGATTATDAYYLAISVPFFAYAVLLAAIRQGSIPLLTRFAAKESAEGFSAACSELVSAVIAAVTLLSLALTAVMLLVLPTLAGGNAHLASLTREYMIELLPYATTGAILGVFGAILAVRGEFVLPALVLGCEPLLKCALVIFVPGLGAQGLVIGSLVGNFIAAYVLWHVIRRRGIGIRMVDFRSSFLVRTVVTVTIPLAVGATVLQFNPLIDRSMAAGLGSGNVTAMELGVRLFSAPAGLLGAILIAPVAATWSARLESDGWQPVARSFARVVGAIVVLVPPMVVAAFFVRHDLVGFVYSSHAYSPQAVARTADVFGVLLFGLVPEILFVPLAALFVIQRETVFPMKVAIANGTLNAVLDLILRGPLGVAGIALSTTVTYNILAAAYFWEARRRWGSLQLRTIVRAATVSGVSCAAIFLAGAILFGFSHASGSRQAELGAAAAAFAIVAVIHGLLVVVGGAGKVIPASALAVWRPLAIWRR
jgi:putative peptidoglycan lipid II flippase